MEFQEEELDYLYSALSHETRRSMIRHMGEEGVLSFTEIMDKSGVRDTGTFGFHLKRTELLLEKLSDGRYKLTPLGEVAHRILKFAEMPKEDQARSLQPPEKPKIERFTSYEGISEIHDLRTLMLNKERLERYRNVIIRDCVEVMIDNDVDTETFRSKVLAFRDISKIVAPKNLYKLVLSRLESDVGEVEWYQCKLPLEAQDSR